MGRSSGGAAAPKGSRYRLALALISLAVALLITTAAYNNAAAPAAALKRYADIIPLLDGAHASVASRIELQGVAPVVTASFVLDRATKLLHPIAGGGAPVPLIAGSLDEVAVDGDNLAWVDLSGTPTVNYYDAARGSVRALTVSANVTPILGTLAAGRGTIAWSYARADGRIGAAVLAPAASQPERYDTAFAENRTVSAVLGPDLFYSKLSDGGDLWMLNTSGGREAQVAASPGAASTATGAFFVAWINTTAGRVEYFDVLDRIVEWIPPPTDVTPTWVLASGVTILIGGTKPGFFSSSPRVEFYDFSMGVAHIYDSIGVDFDQNPYFAYADHTVVSYVEEPQLRPAAPLTPWLLAISLVTLGAAVAEGLRQVFGEDDDL